MRVAGPLLQEDPYYEPEEEALPWRQVVEDVYPHQHPLDPVKWQGRLHPRP